MPRANPIIMHKKKNISKRVNIFRTNLIKTKSHKVPISNKSQRRSISLGLILLKQNFIEGKYPRNRKEGQYT